jgi:hypothetical protein
MNIQLDLTGGQVLAGDAMPARLAAEQAKGFSWTSSDLAEGHSEIRRAQRRGQMPRGVRAARKTFVVVTEAVRALRAWNEDKWAIRVNICANGGFITVGCPEGHGGAVTLRRTKLCGLQCCPNCARLGAKRLAAMVLAEAGKIAVTDNHRPRMLTVSLRPRPSHKQSWDDICKVRTKVMAHLKRIHGGEVDAVVAIEFGGNGHPHLHILYFGKFIHRETLQRKLVVWTGGKVRELPEEEWVREGRRTTKRGKAVTVRKWEAVPPKQGVGGDWYVDVRNLSDKDGGPWGGVREVCKYLANPFGGAEDMRDPEQRLKTVTAARMMVAVAVAGKGRQRVQGYGRFRGIVARALRPNRAPDEAETEADDEGPKLPTCPCCNSKYLVVQGVDTAALAWFNRALPPPPPRLFH